MFLAIAIFVLPILVLAWHLALYPDWMPATPDFSNGRRGRAAALLFWAFFVLFMKTPIWVRLPFLLWAGLKLLRTFGRRLLQAFDQNPDLVISKEGVGGWDKLNFCLVPWIEVSHIRIVEHQGRFLSFPVGPRYEWIEIIGPETGGLRMYGAFPPRRVKLMYSELYFPIKNTEILKLLRAYRPDLIKDT